MAYLFENKFTPIINQNLFSALSSSKLKRHLIYTAHNQISLVITMLTHLKMNFECPDSYCTFPWLHLARKNKSVTDT